MISGEQLRLLRHTQQLKQQAMATLMGISQQRLSALEKSKKLSEENARKALKALGFAHNDVKIVLRKLTFSKV